MKDVQSEQYTNALINETSPYLLSHAHNPVHWYPWGQAAIDLARKENKPIFLSIGYSSCHWCHVMEKESFENEKIAGLLNDNFVSIKVDREEHPEVDAIYMDAVQIMTGNGGWPLSVFLTPDLKPFYGGTYFPATDKYGRPGFGTVLAQIADAWQNRRNEIEKSADSLTGIIEVSSNISGGDKFDLFKVTDVIRRKALSHWKKTFDSKWGGFGNAPKFPPSGALAVLLREYKRNHSDKIKKIIELTLNRMSFGGIYDQLGGGFHRYSVDRKWLVPHFEKMLYDNALLSMVYLEAYQVLGDKHYYNIAREIINYILRDMQSPEGGFYSAEDADSEGEEGLFYLWSKNEIEKTLGNKDSALFCEFYGVTVNGNFEGKNILNIHIPIEEFARKKGIQKEIFVKKLNQMRERLLDVRSKRIRPERDDKIIMYWNGMMISALAESYLVSGEKQYLAAAERAGNFIIDNMIEGGVLYHSYSKGSRKIKGNLDDYAQVALAMLDLYEATFDVKWFKTAKVLTDKMIILFGDGDNGGFYFSSLDKKNLLMRKKPFLDSSVPSGNAVAALLLAKMAEFTDTEKLRELAVKTMQISVENQLKHPAAFVYMLLAQDFYTSHPFEIAVIGKQNDPDTTAMLRAVNSTFMPYKVMALYDVTQPGTDIMKLIPFLADRKMLSGKSTVYICRNSTCGNPIADISELDRFIRDNF